MTACLLLAAGSSSRMGKIKMLLPFRGKTLLQHSIDEINNSSAEKLVVVTGCYHRQLQETLSLQQIEFIENKKWEDGMGTSIQAGVHFITQQYPGTENIIVAVCDQPYISSHLFNQLIAAKKETAKGIVASAYDGTTGTPVLFSKNYFEHLIQLNGHTGAKKIVQQNINDVAEVAFPQGAFDIDTPGDYNALQ